MKSTTQMDNASKDLENLLQGRSFTWLVTGAAGFIGSHLVEALLLQGQSVVGIDNLSTGKYSNIEYLKEIDSRNFRFERIDIVNPSACIFACKDVDIVLHQAALGSVPRSINNPRATHKTNVDGFLNMLIAARDAGVKRFVFASSSSVYGDHKALPKVESVIGTPLSPYAVSKRTNELYAKTFFDHYNLQTIGLRYFNVFGPRQDPNGPYAAVLPRWTAAMLSGEAPIIYGDGETSRDFCYIANVVQANIRASLCPPAAAGHVYNIAVGERTTLIELANWLAEDLKSNGALEVDLKPVFSDFRPGDIRHSLADISSAQNALGYNPTFNVREGLKLAADWYASSLIH